MTKFTNMNRKAIARKQVTEQDRKDFRGRYIEVREQIVKEDDTFTEFYFENQPMVKNFLLNTIMAVSQGLPLEMCYKKITERIECGKFFERYLFQFYSYEDILEYIKSVSKYFSNLDVKMPEQMMKIIFDFECDYENDMPTLLKMVKECM